jgi:hypothetical protein
MRSGPSPARPRVRLTLLVLLWAFAGTVFLVVDLFLNVPAFDEVRPRAKLYRSMRYVGLPRTSPRGSRRPARSRMRACCGLGRRGARTRACGSRASSGSRSSRGRRRGRC